MKKSTKKTVKKATDYLVNYVKMTGLFPEFKKKKKGGRDENSTR